VVTIGAERRAKLQSHQHTNSTANFLQANSVKALKGNVSNNR